MTHELVTAPSGISYPVWRVGAGIPLLLLHGFTGSHKTWSHLADDLAGSHLVTSLDLPGHGRSHLLTTQGLTFASIVDDLAWIIESLLGGKSDVVGYSMGGRLALALAIAHPEHVHRLVLESASPGIAGEQERRARQHSDEQLACSIQRDGLEAFVMNWERLPMWESQKLLPDTVREGQRQIRLGHTVSGLAANLRATGTGVQPSYWDHLAYVETLTMLIAGELDHKFAQTAAAMHERIPHARLEIVPKAGHAVHLEQPDHYMRLISQFLI